MADPGEEGSRELAPAQLAALLSALVRDSDIHVSGHDGTHWALSDQGAAAVLLKMDEWQGRLGTPGALMRKGKRDEALVLPALPLPVLTRGVLAAARPGDAELAHSPELRAALRATLQHDLDDCDRFDDADDEPMQVNRLDDRTLLVAVPCWMAAYNAASGYWLVNDHPPFQPRLVTTAGNDYAAGEISADHKGRGLGDCWSHQAWTWDGTDFVPTSDYQTGMCRGMPGGFWILPTLVSEVTGQPTPE